MEIFENYNNASQKYGKDIVQLMANQGISDKYLLSACRFYVEDKVPCDVIAYKVKQWNQYVVPFQSTDINKLQFDDFNQILLQALRKASMPNKFFDNGAVEIGEFKTYKESKLFPIMNDMCICKTRKWFNYYQSPHSRYLLIHDRRRMDNKSYVVAILEYGEVTYADINGSEFGCSLGDDKDESGQKEFNEYQNSLGPDVLNVIYNACADVRD